MLEQSEVATYLLRRGFISEACIVDGDFTVVDVSRRNRNFKAISKQGPSYMLKQGVGKNSGDGLAYESGVYEFLGAIPGDGSALCDHLPHHYGYDEQAGVLILELLRDAVNLHEHHAQRRRCSVRSAAALGLALSRCHRLSRPALRTTGAGRLPVRTPWVLSLHRPGPELIREVSSANLRLIRIIQSLPEFCQQVDELRQGWRVDSLIHNDIKWENCLVCGPDSKRRPQVKIVDWEFAGKGDSCWDAGAIFSNFLSSWLFSIPLTGEEPPDRYLELAQYPLAPMQPAIHAYWRAYTRGMGLQPPEEHEFLIRATRYAAARLIQTGFEQMQRSTHLTGNLVCLLQLSLNIMLRPHEAIVHLLGMSWKGEGGL
jgi:hypothetical protein